MLHTTVFQQLPLLVYYYLTDPLSCRTRGGGTR